MLSARQLVGLLADPDRRRVVAALILSAGDPSAIARTTGLDQRAVVTALDRLVAGGLVEVGTGGDYVVLEEAFRVAARRANMENTEVGPVPADPDEQVLARSIVDGRLVHLPRKRSKRLVVLDRLAQEFEPGVRYTERQVNARLERFDDDVATLRRWLVDEGFLDRGEGRYWRSGGSVETEGR